MHLFANFALASNDAPARPTGGFDPTFLLLMVGIFAVFYFLIMRPQKKKEQERKEMLKTIRKGDTVRTVGGIYGEVVTARDTFLVLMVDKDRKTTIKFGRAAISAIVTEDEDAEADEA